MSDELKPCPFCGGEARLQEFDDGSGGVLCSECGFMPLTHASYGRNKSKQKAIAEWNQRPESDIEKAHREHRAIILPAPIGAPVYVIYPEDTDTDGSTLPAGVEETRLSDYINEDGREFYLTYDNVASCDIPVADLYTRREAAEAALKEREGK